MNNKDKLIEQIKIAQELLLADSDYFSDSSKEMLLDEINCAKEVLDNEEATQLDIDIATDGGGWVMLDGLAGAISIYKSKHFMFDIKTNAELINKINWVIQKAYSYLRSLKPGDGLGNCDEAMYAELKTAVMQLEKEPNAKLAVQVQNRIKQLKRSVINSHQTSKNDYIYWSDAQAIREKISHPLLKKEYDRIKALADQYTVEDTENIPLNFKSWRTIRMNFMPPAETKYAKIEFRLKGKGQVWLDTLYLEESGAGVIGIFNQDFEEGANGMPSGWKPFAASGTPNTFWQFYDGSNQLYAESGQYSISIENKNSGDEGGFISEDFVCLSGGMPHTLRVMIKQIYLLENLFYITVKFYDKDKKALGESVYDWNMKTTIRWDYIYEMSNADAVCYFIEQDEKYAIKAKRELLHMLDDMRDTGVLFWLQYKQKPFDDGYGTVHMGRAMSGMCVMYDIISRSNIITPEEDAEIRKKIYWIADYLGKSLEDFDEVMNDEVLAEGGNWKADQYVGLIYFGIRFPEYSRSRQYLENAKCVINAELKHIVTEDGAWPESMRYHNAVLQHFTFFAPALKRFDGTDYFAHPKFKKMYAYVIKAQLPQYAYHNNEISHLIFGDDNLGGGACFFYWNIASYAYRGLDDDFADEIYATWKKAGSHVKFGGLNGWLTTFLLTDIENRPVKKITSAKSVCFDDFGIIVMRNNFEQENESCLAIVASRNEVKHGHYDQGSFTFFANKVPLSLDPGVVSYWESSMDWYKSSKAHATIQFEEQNTPLTSTICRFETNELYDYAVILIENPSGKGKHKRHIALIKELNAVAIYDEIIDFKEKTTFNLPISSVKTIIDKNKALSFGHFDTNLETHILLPKNPEIMMSTGAIAGGCIPMLNNQSIQEYLRVEANNETAHLAVLYPTKKEVCTLEIEDAGRGYILNNTIEFKFDNERLKITKKHT